MNLLWIGISIGSIGALVMRAIINEFVALARDISTLRESLFAVDDFELDEFKDPVEVTEEETPLPYAWSSPRLSMTYTEICTCPKGLPRIILDSWPPKCSVCRKIVEENPMPCSPLQKSLWTFFCAIGRPAVVGDEDYRLRCVDKYDADEKAQAAAEIFIKEQHDLHDLSDAPSVEVYVFCAETEEHYRFNVIIEFELSVYCSRACGYPSKKPEGDEA